VALGDGQPQPRRGAGRRAPAALPTGVVGIRDPRDGEQPDDAVHAEAHSHGDGDGDHPEGAEEPQHDARSEHRRDGDEERLERLHQVPVGQSQRELALFGADELDPAHVVAEASEPGQRLRPGPRPDQPLALHVPSLAASG
jgi:hypothetical protein